MESLATSLVGGVVHPVLGLDHLLAMIAIGIVSISTSKSAIWKIPAVFLFAMTCGGIAGILGCVIPRTESLIAVSLVTLGIAVTSSQGAVVKPTLIPISLVYSFVAVFGAAHGNAHGAEIPVTSNPEAFTLGFLIGTSTLHLVGVGLGALSRQVKLVSSLMAIAGVFTASIGIGILARS